MVTCSGWQNSVSLCMLAHCQACPFVTYAHNIRVMIQNNIHGWLGIVLNIFLHKMDIVIKLWGMQKPTKLNTAQWWWVLLTMTICYQSLLIFVTYNTNGIFYLQWLWLAHSKNKLELMQGVVWMRKLECTLLSKLAWLSKNTGWSAMVNWHSCLIFVNPVLLFLTEHCAMKSYWGSGGIAPPILWPWH